MVSLMSTKKEIYLFSIFISYSIALSRIQSKSREGMVRSIKKESTEQISYAREIPYVLDGLKNDWFLHGLFLGENGSLPEEFL